MLSRICLRGVRTLTRILVPDGTEFLRKNHSGRRERPSKDPDVSRRADRLMGQRGDRGQHHVRQSGNPRCAGRRELLTSRQDSTVPTGTATQGGRAGTQRKRKRRPPEACARSGTGGASRRASGAGFPARTGKLRRVPAQLTRDPSPLQTRASHPGN